MPDTGHIPADRRTSADIRGHSGVFDHRRAPAIKALNYREICEILRRPSSWHVPCNVYCECSLGWTPPANQRGIAMFTSQPNRGFIRNVVCLMLAVAIVSVSLAGGAMGLQALQPKATVTITQLA